MKTWEAILDSFSLYTGCSPALSLPHCLKNRTPDTSLQRLCTSNFGQPLVPSCNLTLPPTTLLFSTEQSEPAYVKSKSRSDFLLFTRYIESNPTAFPATLEPLCSGLCFPLRIHPLPQQARCFWPGFSPWHSSSCRSLSLYFILNSLLP